MKLLFFVLASVMMQTSVSFAQKVSLDSLEKVVIQHIADKQHFEPEGWKLEEDFYIEDISTRQSITKQKYGIFEFGLYGYDVFRWIMWYDPSGYKIFTTPLDTAVLGEVIAYLERNHYSAAASYYYMVGLYRSFLCIENIGEPVIQKEE